MHILVIGINYWPEQTSVGPFTTGLCEHLIETGHRVSAITAFPYYPEWRTHEQYRGRFSMRQDVNGVDVHRVWHYVPRRPRGFVERIVHDLSFSLNALFAACAIRDVDAIFCSSPPPFTPVVAWMHARIRRVPYAVNVTDLATEAALSTGIMSAGLLVRLARTLEHFNYSRAAGVSVLCNGFKDRLVNDLGIASERVVVVPSWADTKHITVLDRDNGFRREQGYTPSDFLVVHTGNMGLKQKLETVIEAASLSQDRHPGIKWLLIGDGEEREWLEQLARERSLTNLRFLKLLPRETFPDALASANALVLTQQAAVTDSVIPSKLLTYMASGRAVIASVNSASEAAIRIDDAKCGVIVRPEDPEALLAAAVQLSEDASMTDELGRRGRRCVEATFSKSAVLQQYDDFFRVVFPTALGLGPVKKATAE